MAMNEREIFETALEISDPRARLAFLDKACRGDLELRAKVDSLMQSHEAAGSFLDIPALDQMGGSTANTIVGSPAAGDDDNDAGQADLSFLKSSAKPGSIGTLGHYEILQVLGQGAFGIVFKAFDEKTASACGHQGDESAIGGDITASKTVPARSSLGGCSET